MKYIEPYTSFVDLTTTYYRECTDAPPQYCVHTSIQALGHAMGYHPVNLIQPKAVHHNSYLVLEGKSTITRKTTAENFEEDIYPLDRAMGQENSPEEFIDILAEDSELLQFYGEFTGLVKGIKGQGYMARFAEIYNHIHGCPPRYERRLRGKKKKDKDDEEDQDDNGYRAVILNAYFSVISTVTPEMLREHLTDELMVGGFLARYLIVHGEPDPHPRSWLKAKVYAMEERLRYVLDSRSKFNGSHPIT